MKLIIVEQRCTECGSEEVRSKVTSEEGCLFRCDSCGADFFVAQADLKTVGTAELPTPEPNDFTALKMMPGQQPYTEKEQAQLFELVDGAAASDPGEGGRA